MLPFGRVLYQHAVQQVFMDLQQSTTQLLHFCSEQRIAGNGRRHFRHVQAMAV